MQTDIAGLIKSVTLESGGTEDNDIRTRAILDAFVEVAVRTSETNDLEGILHLVAERTCQLVGVSRCSIFLRGDDGVLRGQVGHSPSAEIDDLIRKLTAGGDRDLFTQELVSNREPLLILDAANDSRLDQQAVGIFDIKDILGVPLVVDNEVIGALYLDNISDERVYTSEEIEVAATFAKLTALAIRRAWTTSQLIRRATIIERQRNLLERLSRVHAELTSAVLDGESVANIVKRVVTLVEKPVVVYDSSFREVIAYAVPENMACDHSPRIPLKAVGSPWFSEQLQSFGPGRSSIIVPPSASIGLTTRRALSPLRVDNSVAGYLEIVEIGQQINAIDLKVLEHGATVVSLAFLSERRSITSEEQTSDEFLIDLLEARRRRDVLERRTSAFGIEVDRAHVILRVLYENEPSAASSRDIRRAELVDILDTGSGVACPLSASVGNADVFVIGPLPDGSNTTIEALRDALKAAILTPGNRHAIRNAALSGPISAVDDYQTSDRELQDVLTFLDQLGSRSTIVAPSDLGMLRLLSGSDSAASSRSFAADLIRPLVVHDQKGDGELVATLRGYLTCGAHIRKTAAWLGVHENTIRYRLGKIASISSINPDDLDDLMSARLALTVLDLLGSDDVAAITSSAD